MPENHQLYIFVKLSSKVLLNKYFCIVQFTFFPQRSIFSSEPCTLRLHKYANVVCVCFAVHCFVFGRVRTGLALPAPNVFHHTCPLAEVIV